MNCSDRCQHCLWWLPNRPEIAEAVEHCLRLDKRTEIDDTCPEFVGASATKVNVPQHTKNGEQMDRNTTPPDGPVQILIVTYQKDFPWLMYALRAIERHATGFSGVTVLIPSHDLRALTDIARETGLGLTRYIPSIRTFFEAQGRGMLQHMVMMATAEKLVPSQTKYVLHMDSDCIFKMPTDASDYFMNGKPAYLYRTWESLTTEDPKNPGTKVISDCAQWRGPTEQQLGQQSTVYTMTRHPTVFPIDFYQPYRQHIGKVHGDFESYMMAGRNQFPQDRMDFTAMGQWAWTHMRERFHWINVASEPYPEDRMKAFWSHGGVTPEIKAEIEGFLT